MKEFFWNLDKNIYAHQLPSNTDCLNIQIGNSDDLGRIFAGYGDNRFETTRFLFINKQNLIVRHVALTYGNPGQTCIDSSLISLHELVEQAKNKNQRIVIGHNHPSGNINPSPADEKTTKLFMQYSQKNGGVITAHYIYDRWKYTYCGQDGIWTCQTKVGSQKRYEVPGEKDIKKIMTAIRNTKGNDINGLAICMYINARYEISGVSGISVDNNTTFIQSQIKSEAQKCGGIAVNAFCVNKKDYELFVKNAGPAYVMNSIEGPDNLHCRPGFLCFSMNKETPMMEDTGYVTKQFTYNELMR